jgi:putative ABC transport system permease protein
MGEKAMWRRYLRFLGNDPGADVEDELEFHFAMRVEDLMRQGQPEPAAREQAKREFGDVGEIQRELKAIGRRRLRRKRRIEGWEWLGQDVRFALRTLGKRPAFAAVAVLTLALGIGASTAMFSVLHGVLLRDLPVREQDEVVVLWTESADGATDHLPISQGDLIAFRDRTRAFQSVAGVAYQGAMEHVLLDAGQAVSVEGTWVTGEFFPLLGLVPEQGRTLAPLDDVRGAEPVMVISYGFWQRYFGGQASAVGHRLELDGRQYTVVGILPRGFDYPKRADFWVPVFAVHPEEAQKTTSGYVIYDLVGRLRPGAERHHAREDFAAFLRATDAERPAAQRGMTPVVTPLAELLTREVRGTLWAISAAVALLLLIACVNVANLLLIRGSERVTELAVRSAIGAGKRRLVRQLLTESTVLAMLGGALGILLAVAAVRLLVAVAPPELPRREMITVDAWVLIFALAASVAASLFAGLLPAVLTARGDLSGWLRGGPRGGASSHAARALRHGLVIGQIGLAIVVVVGAGLLVRSLISLQRVDLGFNPERLLIVQTTLPPGAVPERSSQVALLEEVLQRVGALPGVASAAALPARPFAGTSGWSAMYTGEGQGADAQAANPWVNFEVVGPEYFRTLQIPVRRGRAFTEQDREDARPVAIISEAVARHTWPGADPLGRRIKLGPPEGPGEWHTVAGIVGETRYRELTTPQPTLYLPIRQFGGPVPMSLAIRTRRDPAAVTAQVRQVLPQIHPQLMLVGGGPLRQLLAAPLARPRFSTLLLGSFAGVTLLLAAVGIYGAMAATTRYRTREIGVRLALGATPQGVRALVLRQGMWLALWGSVLGLGAALLATRALRGSLFSISPTDPLTFAAVALLILATAALACYLPARRASRVDPVHALRAE